MHVQCDEFRLGPKTHDPQLETVSADQRRQPLFAGRYERRPEDRRMEEIRADSVFVHAGFDEHPAPHRGMS